MNEKLTLFHYWRSSSSWRVRWALKMKKIDGVEYVAVNLLTGESESQTHLKRNPLGFVPVLQVGEKFLVESVAIIEWLEELIPSPSLFPGNSYDRAQIRSLVEIVNAGTQPVQNLTVTDKITDDEEKRGDWNRFFIRRGLGAYQTLAERSAGKFSVGDQVTAADLFLVPQLYNAARNEIDVEKEFPLLHRIQSDAQKTAEYAASNPDAFKP